VKLARPDWYVIGARRPELLHGVTEDNRTTSFVKGADMTFQAFLNDPKGYLSTHELYVANSPAALTCLTHDAAHALPGGLQRMRWRQRPAGPFPTFTSAAHLNAKTVGEKISDTARHLPFRARKVMQYTLASTVNDLGLRYLPFNENHVTYMRIHGAANFVVTGPLTGCTIAAVPGAAGEWWFIHSNENAGAGIVGARLAQMTGITDLLAHLGIGLGNLITCEFGAGAAYQYNGFGFVFGVLRPNGTWKFYSHATTANGQTATRKWGEL
jgi:hypothetical protein